MVRRGGLALLGIALVCADLASVSARAETVPLYEPHTVLVGFVPGTTEGVRAQDHAALGARVTRRFAGIGLDVARLPEGVSPLVAAARYRTEPGVAYAELNRLTPLDSIPNDPRFGDEWGLNNTGQLCNGCGTIGTAGMDVRAVPAWDQVYGSGVFPSSGGAVVGVIDSGIDQSHADLAGKVAYCAKSTGGTGIVASGCADDNGHGTHVSGTIAANTNNGVGVAGVAPNARLAMMKVFAQYGSTYGAYTSDIIAGVDWMVSTAHARVISMSFGSSQSDSSEASEMSYAHGAGVLLVAAAGNSGDATISYPAGYADVVSVGAIDAGGSYAYFSTYNSDVEIAAPGEDIWSTWPGGGYQLLSGTSMSTPHVSGVAGVLFGADPTLTNDQVRSILDASAHDLGSTGRDAHYGYGLVDLNAAVGRLAPIIQSPPEGYATNQTSITISGTTHPDTAVTVTEGSVTIGTTTSTSAGSWTLTSTFGAGSHAVRASVVSGSVTLTSQPRTFSVDLALPDAPVITTPVQGDALTTSTVTIAGTRENATSIIVKDGTHVIASVPAGGTTWSAQATLQNGSHSLTAVARDSAGNVSAPSAAVGFTVSSQLPDSPVITNPVDGTLEPQTFVIQGTAPSSTTVIVRDGTTSIGSAPVGPSGTWSASVRAPAGGDRTITATARDGAGNQSVASFPLHVTVDVTPPQVGFSTPSNSVMLFADLAGGASDSSGIAHVRLTFYPTGMSQSSHDAACASCPTAATSVDWTDAPD
ncbi:MAG: S8 family serine peptidase, partial [Actinobacteria bacterium]|nr:S8 family serine peptidase [Actinomycetota bacterium]